MACRYFSPQIELLEAEVATYEKMFAAQEQTLAEAAKKAAIRAESQPMGTGSSGIPGGSDSVLHRRNASEFAFDELLTKWRKQTHKCMVQQLLMEKEKTAIETEAKKQRCVLSVCCVLLIVNFLLVSMFTREDFSLKSQAANVELNAIRAKLRSAHSLIESQEEDLEARRSELERERSARVAVEDRARSLDSGFSSMRYSRRSKMETLVFYILIDWIMSIYRACGDVYVIYDA